jgi:type IX secretion system PorP/SprF family membrane protein
MKRMILTISLCVTYYCSAIAQDIHFSQFFETPLLRNPALAGIFNGDIRLQSVYRTQWNSVTTPYLTGSFNMEFKKPIGKGHDFCTIGAQIMYDKAGTIALTSNHVLPVINYHKSLSSEKNTYLSLGFMGGLVQRKIDRSKVTTNNQFDGTGFNPGISDGESFPRTSYSYLDGTVGMSLNVQLGENADNNLYVGGAYHHFNKATKLSFYGKPNYEMVPKWVGSLGLRMGMTESSYFTIYGDYSKQGTYQETLGGFFYSVKLDDNDNPFYTIHGGALMRWKDAIIPVVKLDFLPFSISASYDVNTSTLRTASYGQGGFEFALSYVKAFNRDSEEAEAVRCPRF